MSIERRRLLIVASLSVLVAITRLFADAHSIWDWDEGLFIAALRSYDVAARDPGEQHRHHLHTLHGGLNIEPFDNFRAFDQLCFKTNRSKECPGKWPA